MSTHPTFARRAPAALALLAACALAAPALAAPPPAKAPKQPPAAEPKTPKPAAAELLAAEQAYANLDYAAAHDAADRVAQQSDLSHDQLVRSTRLLALTNAALDRSAAAKDAFVALIAYDPEFELDPKLGPRFQDPYYEAKGYWKAQARKPGVEATPSLRPQAPGVLRVSLSDPTAMADHLNVGFRWAPALEYSRLRLAPNETQVEVPAPPPGSARFDYYVQAVDRRNNVLFERGNPDAPRGSVVLAPMAPESNATARRDEGGGSIFSKPLFWVAAGILAAGGATGSYFLFRDNGGPATTARVVPTLGCGGVRCE